MATDCKPLAGLVVVALEQAVAAPLCSRHLADLGAEVIKIERIDGGDFSRDYDTYVDGMSSHFVWLNRNKRSLAVDLKSPDGQDVLLRLLERADVFLSNLAPGALDRLIPDETIADRNPSLIRCAISGYGPNGPFEHRKAFDLLVQGEAGVTASTGDPGDPAKPGVSLADLGGGIYATTSILAALHQRTLTGKGAKLHIAMFDVLIEWMAPLLLAYTEGGVEVAPAGTRHATITPYGPYPTASGPPVNIAVQNDRQWVSLCQALDEADLAADPRLTRNAGRLEHRQFVEKSISTTTSRMSAAELTSALDAAGVPWGMLNGIPEVAKHPQLATANRWMQVGLPSGARARVPDSPFRFEWEQHTEPADAPNPRVPALGQDTKDILRELGYSEPTIDALIKRGALAPGTAMAPPPAAHLRATDAIGEVHQSPFTEASLSTMPVGGRR
jgi:crotonobetainyl-CoA:carnitine CoA-transferase CaiB-like acyl-CoA transferase